MIEVEVKVRLTRPKEFLNHLAAIGFRPSGPPADERNTVYDRPDMRLYAEGKLLRVRETGGRAILTYKAPSGASGPYKTREEHELETHDAAGLHSILTGLGFEPFWIYEKRRTEFRQPGGIGVIEFDETPIGVFAEFEGPPDWIDRSAALFGFQPEDYITSTYRELFLEWREATGSAGRNMVFSAASGEDSQQ